MGSNVPEIGSRISLISKSGIRYEGSLFAVDPDDCTIALASVRSFGTENRNVEDKIPGTNHIYEYILFRGSDIKDIQMIETRNLPNDPAIVHTAVMPQPQQQQQPRPSHQTVTMAPTVPFVRPIVYQQQQQPHQFASMTPTRQSNLPRIPMQQQQPQQQPQTNQLVFNRTDSNAVQQQLPNTSVSSSPATRTSSTLPNKKPEKDQESVTKPLPKSAVKKQRKPAVVAAAAAAAAPASNDTDNEQQKRLPKQNVTVANVPGQLTFENSGGRDYQQQQQQQQQQPRKFRRDYGTGPVLDNPQSGFMQRQQYQQPQQHQQQQYRQGWRPANNFNRYGNDNVGYGGGPGNGNGGGYRQFQRTSNYRYQNGDQRRNNVGGGGGGRHQMAAVATDNGVVTANNGNQRSMQFNRTASTSGGAGGTIADNNGNNKMSRNQHQQNRTPKIQFKEDYDFEQANIEFEELRQKLDNVTLKAANDENATGTNDETAETNASEQKESIAGGAVGTNGANETAATNDANAVYYDKCKSFFDNISCGESETNQKPDWNKERKLNTETFGLTLANNTLNTNNNRRRPNRDNNNRNRVFTNRSGGGGAGGAVGGNDRRNYYGNRHGYHYNNQQQQPQQQQRNNSNHNQQGSTVVAASN